MSRNLCKETNSDNRSERRLQGNGLGEAKFVFWCDFGNHFCVGNYLA
jgi:hypothetical protein